MESWPEAGSESGKLGETEAAFYRLVSVEESEGGRGNMRCSDISQQSE